MIYLFKKIQFFQQLLWYYYTKIQKSILIFNNSSINMGVRREGQGGSLAPPPSPRPAKNSMFLDFFGKNSNFFVAFQAKSRFLAPPGKFLPSPGKKSADAHEYKTYIKQVHNIKSTHVQNSYTLKCNTFYILSCAQVY